jgi:hypothetical protein
MLGSLKSSKYFKLWLYCVLFSTIELTLTIFMVAHMGVPAQNEFFSSSYDLSLGVPGYEMLVLWEVIVMSGLAIFITLALWVTNHCFYGSVLLRRLFDWVLYLLVYIYAFDVIIDVTTFITIVSGRLLGVQI